MLSKQQLIPATNNVYGLKLVPVTWVKLISELFSCLRKIVAKKQLYEIGSWVAAYVALVLIIALILRIIMTYNYGAPSPISSKGRCSFCQTAMGAARTNLCVFSIVSPCEIENNDEYFDVDGLSTHKSPTW